MAEVDFEELRKTARSVRTETERQEQAKLAKQKKQRLTTIQQVVQWAFNELPVTLKEAAAEGNTKADIEFGVREYSGDAADAFADRCRREFPNCKWTIEPYKFKGSDESPIETGYRVRVDFSK
jgi:hypothetical protein